MKLTDIDGELENYQDVFSEFVRQYQLPSEFFKEPDHFAIKCANEIDYIDTLHEFKDEFGNDGAWELSMDGRLLASASLLGRVSLAGNDFSWIEIMQPRPGKETPSGFVEHTEFYFPDFFHAERILYQRGIDYEQQKNSGHSWINIPIDELGKEIKLNDKKLADVVDQEKKMGILRKVGGSEK